MYSPKNILKKVKNTLKKVENKFGGIVFMINLAL